MLMYTQTNTRILYLCTDSRQRTVLHDKEKILAEKMILLSTETVFFGVLIVAYVSRLHTILMKSPTILTIYSVGRINKF